MSNQVDFITGKCLEGFPALQSEKAKSIFWDRFEFHANQAKFQPWIVSVLDNHYHVVGYCELGDNLPEMMRKFHGSTSKLINDLLVKRRVPFWRDEHDHDYNDGCLRDVLQLDRAYRYVLRQSARHGICLDWREYQHTRVYWGLVESIRFAVGHRALLEGVPYKRYLKKFPDRQEA